MWFLAILFSYSNGEEGGLLLTHGFYYLPSLRLEDREIVDIICEQRRHPRTGFFKAILSTLEYEE
jgi:hypothetical protein